MKVDDPAHHDKLGSADAMCRLVTPHPTACMQEEERDDEWETSESESADEPDTDFDESVRFPMVQCMWADTASVCRID